MKTNTAVIALTRFGMGARPDEIGDIGKDARGWLKAQIAAPKSARISAKTLKSSPQVLSELGAYKVANSAMKKSGENADDVNRARKDYYKVVRGHYEAEVQARNLHAVSTADSFTERWVRFWSNHFTVARRQRDLIGLVGPHEREAIRPNIYGSFRDLLFAATFHPAMLVYLDNHRSIGPNTRRGRRSDNGLNENLAREILELHTLGVGGGYTQDDIIAFAKTLTGWTVKGFGRGGGRTDKGTVFNEALHEPGKQTVLGQTYSSDAKVQAATVLADIAKHPSTAAHIAQKLARHFFSDTPQDKDVETLRKAFVKSGGDLSAMARAVIDIKAAWVAEPIKFKTPEELLISTARLIGYRAVFSNRMAGTYRGMGQVPFTAPSPDGWADTAGEWVGPDAIKKRLEWANGLSRQTPRDWNGLEILDRGLGGAKASGGLVSGATLQMVRRAESRTQALTMAFMSPEFQRR